MIACEKNIAPNQLAKLFSLRPAAEAWTETDLRQIFAHQLRAELEFDLRDIVGIGKATVLDLRYNDDPAIITFADLLSHPQPPMPLLQLLKEFGKDIAHQVNSDMPADIGRVLYYAAIALALRRHQTRISSLSDDDLIRGLRWACELPWIPPTLSDLFTGVSTKLAANP